MKLNNRNYTFFVLELCLNQLLGLLFCLLLNHKQDLEIFEC